MDYGRLGGFSRRGLRSHQEIDITIHSKLFLFAHPSRISSIPSLSKK